MFLSISISINVWLLTIVVARFFLNCLFPLTWSMLLTLFVVSLLMTVAIHIYNWKCWRYLRHGPQRLRSFTTETPRKHIKIGIILFIWLETITFIVISWFCWREAGALVFLSIIPAIIMTYTASTCSSADKWSEPDESLEPPSSNVNTDASLEVSDTFSETSSV